MDAIGTVRHIGNPEVPDDLLGISDAAARLDLARSLEGIATWEFDLVGDVIHWLDEPSDVLGLPVEPEGRRRYERIVAPVITALSTGAPWEHYDVDVSVPDAEDEQIPLKVRARRLTDVAGDTIGCVGVVVDSGEQRRFQSEIEALLGRFRLLVELSPDAIVVHQDGVLRYANPAAARLAKLERASEMIGREVLDFVHPHSLEDTLERMAKLQEPGDVAGPVEATLVRSDASPIPMEATSVLTQWEGRPAYQVILRDVSERRRAEAAMRYQASLVAHVSDAIVAADNEAKITSWNAAAEQLYGWSPDEVMGQTLREVFGRVAVDASGSLVEGEVRHRTNDERILTVMVSVAPVPDPVGDTMGMVAVCSDLTEIRRSELERQEAEDRYTAVVAALEEGVLVVDRSGTITSTNRSARAIFSSVLRDGMAWNELVEAARLAREGGGVFEPGEDPLARTLATGIAHRDVVLEMGSGSEMRWLSLSAQPLVEPGTRQPHSVACSFSDITERRKAEDELAFRASHDALTGLAGRQLFVEGLRSELAGADPGAALVFLDIDRFKVINDAFGHVAGDEVLRSIATRVLDACRSGDSVARLASDEFIVLCRGCEGPDDAHVLAEQLRVAASQPIPLSTGREVAMTASVGVAMTSGTDSDPEQVIQKADVAMYRAKERGGNRIEFFDEDLHNTILRRMEIERELRTAIDERQITVKFQPIASLRTGAIVGVEALARWEHPQLGSVPPSDFIPVAEESGLMPALGAHILHEACAQLSALDDLVGSRHRVRLSVNLSPRQLDDPDLVSIVAGTLHRTGLEAERLNLEVTESVLVERDRVGGVLTSLHDLGVSIAIDDFGTGYSSLSYLKGYPIETLKIDRSFVDGLGKDEESEVIVGTIIGLARSLGLHTVAEGVETAEHLDFLHRLGCDFVQGYLLSRPVDLEELLLDLDASLGSPITDRAQVRFSAG